MILDYLINTLTILLLLNPVIHDSINDCALNSSTESVVLRTIEESAHNAGPIVWTEPAFATQLDDITLFYDASEGNGALKDFEGAVYGHMGLITDQSTSSADWKYVIGNWGTADTRTRMNKVGDNLYSLEYNITDFHKVPTDMNVLQLTFVFRSENGSVVGRDTDGSDIYLDIFPADFGLQILLNSPQKKDEIIRLGDSLLIEAELSEFAFLEIENNGETIFADTTDGTSLKVQGAKLGSNLLDFTASNQDTMVFISVEYLVLDTMELLVDPPLGLQNGINYTSDSSFIFQLFAPSKDHVFLLTNANSFSADPGFQMQKSLDESIFWVELPKTKFEDGNNLYQYLVDGNIKVADPYSEVVLDPNNDFNIDPSVMVELPAYPEETASGIITVFDLDPNQGYQFITKGYQKPQNQDLIIYELLLRDFLKDHSYTSLIDTLDYLERLGVNAIELMPISEFEGNESWGYNPSFHMAVDKYYGSKDQLKEFIDAAHQRGIAVILDVVFNHTFSQGPLAQLYWDPVAFRPAADNPWLNQVARHPFNVGYDFNHQYAGTKSWVKQILSYWMNEFKFDGFRFDLSKGLTQKLSSDDSVFRVYDPSRIVILKDYADHIWSSDSSAYVILEHFADNREETELANYGMLLWGNMNHDFIEAAKGSRVNLRWADYIERGWAEPHLITYMESHDEERLMYRVLKDGDGEDGYNTRNPNTALQRSAAAQVINFTIPGPKMIWQFGELGYDFSINRCVNGSINNDCRLDPKPIHWDYAEDIQRKKLFDVIAGLAHLKATYPTFATGDFVFDDSNQSIKSVRLNHPEMDAISLVNFRVIESNIIPKFQYPGIWYEYFTGDSLEVINVEDRVLLLPGEYRIYTSKRIMPPIGFTTSVSAVRKPVKVTVYPNPMKGQSLQVVLPENENVFQAAIINVDGIHKFCSFTQDGNSVQLSVDEPLLSGFYILQLRTSTDYYIAKFVK